MEFVADLADSLAWPFAACLAGWFLREPIKAVARNMGVAPVRRARIGGFEIEFGEILAAAIDDAAGIVQEPDSKQVAFCLTEEGALVDVHRLLPHSPHAAVLSAWSRLEETLKELVRDADIGTGEGTARTLALAALGEGLISKTTFDAINRLARLRDLTANGLAEPDRSQVEEFIEVVMTVLYAIYVADALRESAEARAQDGYRPSPP